MVMLSDTKFRLAPGSITPPEKPACFVETLMLGSALKPAEKPNEIPLGVWPLRLIISPKPKTCDWAV